VHSVTSCYDSMCSMFVQQRLLICLDLQPRFLAQHRFETFVHGSGMHMQKVSDDYDSVRIMDVNITITVKSSRKEKWGHRAASTSWAPPAACGCKPQTASWRCR